MKEGVDRLRSFVGKWRGESEVKATPFNTNGWTNVSTIVGRLALEDAFVFVDEVMEQAKRVTFRSHRVFGYDPGKQVYTLHFFDSDGANSPTRAEGGWAGNVLTLEQQTPFGRVRYTYAFEGDEHLHRTEVSEDGQNWSTYISGHFRKLRESDTG